jgi:dsRNA-specific ribonuclease
VGFTPFYLPAWSNWALEPETDLQERNQLHALSWEESFTGLSHAAEWTVTCKSASRTHLPVSIANLMCKVNGTVKGTGTAAQKTKARNLAAEQALEALGVTD